MTPQEKAKELVEKYMNYFQQIITVEAAKQCALIAVEEIINSGPGDVDVEDDLLSGRTYWQQVKEEIEKL